MVLEITPGSHFRLRSHFSENSVNFCERRGSLTGTRWNFSVYLQCFEGLYLGHGIARRVELSFLSNPVFGVWYRDPQVTSLRQKDKTAVECVPFEIHKGWIHIFLWVLRTEIIYPTLPQFV